MLKKKVAKKRYFFFFSAITGIFFFLIKICILYGIHSLVFKANKVGLLLGYVFKENKANRWFIGFGGFQRNPGSFLYVMFSLKTKLALLKQRD